MEYQNSNESAAGADGQTDAIAAVSSNGESRRDFLKSATKASAGLLAGGLAASATVSSMPATAAGMARLRGANERIHVGQMGIGGQGNAHMASLLRHKEDWNVEYVAVADIYSRHLDSALEQTKLPKDRGYVDYRKMLERKDIDAVWITTPEHWHATQAIHAMEAGKDVYCEKPMCKGVDEALKMHATALRTKRVIQIGSQGTSDPTYHRIGKLISSGKYGPVVWAQGSYCRNTPGGEWEYPIDKEANAENTNWKIFEEPSKNKHAFDGDRFFRWRKYWDYSAGIQGDLFPHVLHPFLIAIGKIEYPRRVVALGNLLIQKDREVPDTVHMMVEYPSGFTVIMAGSTVNQHGLTPTIRMNKATVEFAMFGGGQLHLIPEQPYADSIDEINEKVPGAGESIEMHELNFLECMRDHSIVPNCNIDLATKVQVAISMGEMAYRQQREVRFDTEKLRLL